MKEYTSNSPVFSESIEIPEATDTNHVNNLNPAPMQLLQNTLANRKAIENIGQDITSSADEVYQQSTGYTDTKIAELINGAPSTLDTLGEIAQAMRENENVVDALEAAMGSKAPQAELDGHTGNNTIHITASERTKWNNKLEKTGDASNTTAAFTQASSLANISTGEKISTIMGKVSKAIATLISHVAEKATDSKFGHVKLSDTYKSAVSNGAAANGVGASQKAVAAAYSALNSSLADSLGGLTFGVDADGNPGYIKAGADTVTPFSSQNAYIYNLTLGIQEISTKKLDIVPSEVYVAILRNDLLSGFYILKSKNLDGFVYGANSVVPNYNEETNSVEVNQMYGYDGWSCVIIAIKL